MAVFFGDSFDHYGIGAGSQARLTQGDGAWTSLSAVLISSALAQTGTRCLRLNGASDYIQKGFSVGMTVGAAFALYFEVLDQTTVNRPAIHFMSSGGGILFSLVFNPDGSALVYGSTTATLYGQTAGGLFGAGAWNHFEIKIGVSTTVGTIELRLNGVTVLALTDLNLGATAIGILQFRCTYSSIAGAHQPWNVDDVVLWDTTGSFNNNFVGQARVYTIFPAADDSPFEWDVVGAASGAAAVNASTPDDDTSYIQADTENTVAEFSIAALPVDIVTITSIHLVPRAKITEGGAGVIAATANSNGVPAQGEDKSLSTSYAYRSHVFQNDPDGNIAWTRSKAQNAIYGLKRVS